MRYTYSLPYYTLCTLRWYHTLFFGRSDASGTRASTLSAVSFSAGCAWRVVDRNRFLRATQINSRCFFFLKKSTVKRRCPEPQFVPRELDLVCMSLPCAPHQRQPRPRPRRRFCRRWRWSGRLRSPVGILGLVPHCPGEGSAGGAAG